ncbi:MAG: YihY/virulence factor BrkB family protein, partial [Chlorobi bacterium]|nr:YihY/virulence factor BrkB family protein [Chlorobiota bacterium]
MTNYKVLKKSGKFLGINRLRKITEFNRHYFRGLAKGINEHHLFLSGGGIAFSLMLSIIPFMLLLISILVNFVNFDVLTFQINKLIDTLLPYQNAAEYVKHFLRSRTTEVLKYNTISTYIGGFALFFTSTWLFSSLTTVLNEIFDVKDDKGLIVALLRDFGLVILFIVLILFTTVALPILNFILSLSDKIEVLSKYKLSDFNDFMFWALSIFVIFTIFYLLYYLIPHEKLGKKIPAVGAFWATLLWEGARVIFGYY